MNIRFATAEDTPEVIRLWSLCFPGDEGFRDHFFSQIYEPAHNLLLLRGDRLCAMAQMLPYRMQNGQTTESVTYIYGACTHPDCRRQHLMDRLLHRSFELDRELGRSASVLIPQEEWLFGFYHQFGYVPALFASHEQFLQPPPATPCALRPAAEGDLSAMDALYRAKQESGVYLCRDAAEWRKQLAMFRSCGGEVLCTGPDGKATGYAFLWRGEDEIWAQELVCATKEEELRFVSALMTRFPGQSCRVTGLDYAKRQPLGCVLRHDDAPPADGYINLMLN